MLTGSFSNFKRRPLRRFAVGSLHLFNLETNACYRGFLIEQGFEEFLRIPLYSMRHVIPETLVQRFHVETNSFHLSCGEYAFLPLD